MHSMNGSHAMRSEHTQAKEIHHTIGSYSLEDLFLYFLKLGTIGFGGPIAPVGYMERDLVEERRWITNEEYKRGMALAQLAPGPLAAKLDIPERSGYGQRLIPISSSTTLL